MFPFSLSGSPVAVIRGGTDADRCMPIGIQIIGAHWQEKQILRVAAYLERNLKNWVPAL
nr:amidase family protein [Pseudomonas sp. BSw22131]